MKPIKILHLYPNEMSLYGDKGNILVLKRRLEWRKITAEIVSYESGMQFPDDIDIIFGGGGQDSGQQKIEADFQKIAPKLKKLIEDGIPTLLVCGMYQLFGEYYQTGDGEKIRGANILNLYTVAGKKRNIGDVILKSKKFGEIVGYENHSGQTFLGGIEEPLGEVVSGFGNNSKDESEGIIYKNCIGTYLHGPILPKNPQIADFLIKEALKRRKEIINLANIDNNLEERVRRIIKSKKGVK